MDERFRLLTTGTTKVFVDGFSSYAIVVWLAEDTSGETCEDYVKNQVPFSQKVDLEPLPCGTEEPNVITGSIPASAWGGDADVKYSIQQSATPPCKCDPYKEKPYCPDIISTASTGGSGDVEFGLTKNHTYGIISSITLPYYLEAEKTNATLSVTYYDSFVNECDETITFTGVSTVKVSDSLSADCTHYGIVSGKTSVQTLDGAYTFTNVSYEFFHTKPSYCDCNTDEPIIEYGRATYVPDVVPYSGETVHVTLPYVEITLKDCIETRVNKVSSYTIDISANTGCNIIYDVRNQIGLNQLYNEDDPRCKKCSDQHDVWYNIEVVKVMDRAPRYVDDSETPIDGNDVGCDCSTCPTITPDGSRGGAGEKRFDLMRGGQGRPEHMMPYYGGLAYARVNFTSYTLNEDCETISGTGEVIIPIEVEPIRRADCNPETYMCNSYEIVYGPDHEGVQNRDIACVAQSTDCDREEEDCDHDDFSLNPTEFRTYCYAAYNVNISTYHSMCIKPEDVSATTNNNWIHLYTGGGGKLNGYSIIADIDENASTTDDRSGVITVTHKYLGNTYTSTINVIQQKCNVECNCGSMMNDVPSGSDEVYISAYTGTLPYSGNTGKKALWVYDVENGCTPMYCITPNDGTVFDTSTGSYTGGFKAISGSVKDNEDPNNDKTIRVALSFSNNCNDVCDTNGRNVGTEIIQSRFVCDCAKLNQSTSSMRSDIPAAGSTSSKIKIGEISTYKGSSSPICAANSKIICEQLSSETQFVTNISVATSSNGTNNGSFTNVNVSANVAANNSVNERNFTIVVYITSGSASEKIECFRLTGKQKAIECACSDVTYTDVGQTSYDEGQHTFTAFTYSFASGKSACESKMGNPTSSSAFVTVSKSNGKIVCNMAANTTTQDRSATISISMGGQCTHTFTVTQSGRCPIYTINPNNGSGESGNKTFTLTSQ